MTRRNHRRRIAPRAGPPPDLRRRRRRGSRLTAAPRRSTGATRAATPWQRRRRRTTAELAVALRVRRGEVHVTIGPPDTMVSLAALDEALETFVPALEVVPWGPGVDITPFVERLARARGIRVRQVRA